MSRKKEHEPNKMLISKQLEIKPTQEYTSKRLYSNYVNVSRSQFDVSLVFCDIQSVIVRAGKQPPTSIDAPVQVEVVIPLALLEPLINALKSAQDMGKTIHEATKE